MYGYAPVANAGCRYHGRRTRLACESVLYCENARDGRLCPRTAGRERYLARSPCRSLRGRCRGNLLLRRYPRNEFAYCWPRYHRLQRFRLEKADRTVNTKQVNAKVENDDSKEMIHVEFGRPP